jgi:hypothetical protein
MLNYQEIGETKNTRRSQLCAGLFLLASVEPSISVVHKYFGTPGLFVFLFLSILVAICLTRWPAWRLARTSTRTASYCAILALVVVLGVTLFVYPNANVHGPMRGSDRDDALLEATAALLRGEFPYSRPTYLGNPITPLPGALILAIPFVLVGNVALANVFWCGALFLVLRLWLGDPRPALLALMLVLFSPEVMHEIATGGDMFANGVYVGLFVLLVAIVIPDLRFHWLTKAVAAALLGIGLSSRPTYVMLVPVLFEYLRRRVGLRLSTGMVAVSILVLVGVTLPFYLASPSRFAPFHLATKLANSGGFIPHAEFVIPALTVALSFAFLFGRLETPGSLLAASGVVVGFPTYVLALTYPTIGAIVYQPLQYFAAGLTSAGLYVIALGSYLATPQSSGDPWVGRRHAVVSNHHC